MSDASGSWSPDFVPPGTGPALVQWVLTLLPDGRVEFRRMVNGHSDEAYRTATPAEAPAWAAAIVAGFDPPRVMLPSDRPRSIA